MAIVQISRITQRKGLQIDLPQLAGAELGWSLDTRQLWIGNGTLEEGAPVVGNTEILTEFSDVLNLSRAYTYSGYAATGYTVQTGSTAGNPVTTSLQNWMDQFATIKDFGAVGDGVTDDTAAINRALYQIYCREVNPAIRRSIFFPAGVYRVTDTILIPPYATLYGEGPDNSVILLDSASAASYLARTADSLQQSGPDIGNNGATTPYAVNIRNLGFVSESPTADVFLLEDANEINFITSDFHGPLTTADLDTAVDDISCIAFSSTPSLVTQEITFTGCNFGQATYAMNTDDQVKSVAITACNLNTLYQGVVLGTGTVINGGPTGFAITGCDFDNIYAEGIVFGNVSLNATAQNVFYDVGNHFGGTTQPQSVIFDIQNANNISVGDMFERSAVYATIYPRIRLNQTASIAFTNGEQIAMGTFVRQTGQLFTMLDNQTSAAPIFTFDATDIRAFCVDYTITRGTGYQTGKIMVVSSAVDSTGDMEFTDDYVANQNLGVTFTVSESADTVSLKYTTSNTGSNADFNYSITYLG